MGANLAAVSIVFSFLPNYSDPFADITTYSTTQSPIVLNTQKGRLQYPLDNISITQNFKFYHPGLDFDATTGDPIYPIMDGKIEAIQYSNQGYGNAVIINHGNKITSLYAHLSRIFVIKNQEVTKEASIGTVGSTGKSSGDHLHLEIRDDGSPINPKILLPE